jgi:hypothetical protein
VFLPLLGLPLLAPRWLLPVAPPLLLNLAAVQPEHHQLRFHYLATAAPLLAAGAVAGLAVVRSARRQWLAPLLVLLVLVAGFTSWRYGPAPWARDPVAIPAGPTDQVRREALALVADGAPVSAQYNLVPHLGHRVEVYEFPNPFRAVNWGLDGDEHPPAALDRLRFVVVQRDLLGEQDRQLLDRLQTDPAWRTLLDRQEVVVLERRGLADDRPAGGGSSLSIVLPCLDEAERLPGTLAAYLAHFPPTRAEVELIVVDDGSTDGTTAIADQIAAADPRVRVVRTPHNHGKGYAVRIGIQAAQGELVVFTDADGSYGPEQMERVVAALQRAPVAIGARLGSQPGGGSPLRRLASPVFNRVMRLLLGLPFSDTQCGLKGFRRDAAEALFQRARVDGFAFDAEALLVARPPRPRGGRGAGHGRGAPGQQGPPARGRAGDAGRRLEGPPGGGPGRLRRDAGPRRGRLSRVSSSISATEPSATAGPRPAPATRTPTACRW